jgi:hypothetical protein
MVGVVVVVSEVDEVVDLVVVIEITMRKNSMVFLFLEGDVVDVEEEEEMTMIWMDLFFKKKLPSFN